MGIGRKATDKRTPCRKFLAIRHCLKQVQVSSNFAGCQDILNVFISRLAVSRAVLLET